MAIQHIKEGSDFFAPDYVDQHRAFGFQESAVHPDFPPTKGTKDRPEPADVGEGASGDYAKGGTIHPHGHDVVRVEHRQHDGAVVHHHAHGGHSVHHKDGRVTHHNWDGSPAGMPGGIEHMHDAESEYAHGGHHRDHPDEARDRALIREMMAKEERGEPLAHGGLAHRATLPRGMRPAAMRGHSPVNSAPRNPNVSPSTPNAMPGGVMPYGVQPGTEPGMDAGPRLRKGGAARKRARE